MIIYWEMEQQSPEWFEKRLGIPTASRFDKIITPAGKASSQADDYANTLVAEWLMGAKVDIDQNYWMQRGVELEPEAVAAYEFEHDMDTQTVGFVTTDDGWIGASPDRMVGDDGIVEVKCPAPHTHIGYLLKNELPGGYRAQVQGQLMVTERQWCDWISYHPDMPTVVVRVYRDEEYIEQLRILADKLTEQIRSKRQSLTERGLITEQPAKAA